MEKEHNALCLSYITNSFLFTTMGTLLWKLCVLSIKTLCSEHYSNHFEKCLRELLRKKAQNISVIYRMSLRESFEYGVGLTSRKQNLPHPKMVKKN